MHIRCTYCNHSYNLPRDYVVQAVQEAEEKGLKYFQVECNNCRKQIKVPVRQMRRYLPREEESES